MIVMPSLSGVRAALGRRGAVVRGGGGAARARELRAAVGVVRVAAAVPEVVAAHLAGVRAGARRVRELDQAGVVRRVVAQVVAVVPALGAAGGGTAGHVARRAVGAQVAGRPCGRGRPAWSPCSTASRSCRRAGSGPRSRRSTGPRSRSGCRRPGRPTPCTARRSPGRSRGGSGCAGPSRRSRAWSCRRRPRCRRTGSGRSGDCAVGSAYVLPTPGCRAGRDVRQRPEPQHLAVVVVGVARGPARVLVGVVRACRSARSSARLGPVGHLATGLLPE